MTVYTVIINKIKLMLHAVILSRDFLKWYITLICDARHRSERLCRNVSSVKNRSTRHIRAI